MIQWENIGEKKQEKAFFFPLFMIDLYFALYIAYSVFKLLKKSK